MKILIMCSSIAFAYQHFVKCANKEQIGLLQATMGIVALYGHLPAVLINPFSA